MACARSPCARSRGGCDDGAVDQFLLHISKPADQLTIPPYLGCQNRMTHMTDQALGPGAPLLGRSGLGPVSDYWVDALQRSVLLLDVLRQRGNIAKEHNARPAPNVLHYEAEVL